MQAQNWGVKMSQKWCDVKTNIAGFFESFEEKSKLMSDEFCDA